LELTLRKTQTEVWKTAQSPKFALKNSYGSFGKETTGFCAKENS